MGSEGLETLLQQQLVIFFLSFFFLHVKYEVLPEIPLLRFYLKEMMRDLNGVMCLSLFMKLGNKLNVLE